LSGSASRRPSVCSATPSFLQYRWAQVTDPFNYNLDCAYANEFPVAVEDFGVLKVSTIALEAVGIYEGA
jgi:hypothetical protein